MPSRTRPLDTAKAMRKQAQDYAIYSDYIPEGLEDTWRQIQAGGGCSSVSAGCCYLCLYISAKIHEDAYLTLDHIKLLSGNLYTPEDVEKEESLILNAVEWRVNPPTPSAFSDEILNVIPSRTINYLMRLLPVDMIVHDFNVLTTI